MNLTQETAQINKKNIKMKFPKTIHNLKLELEKNITFFRTMKLHMKLLQAIIDHLHLIVSHHPKHKEFIIRHMQN